MTFGDNGPGTSFQSIAKSADRLCLRNSIVYFRMFTKLSAIAIGTKLVKAWNGKTFRAMACQDGLFL